MSRSPAAIRAGQKPPPSLLQAGIGISTLAKAVFPPTDLATATLSDGGISTGTDYKLQLVKSGNALTCNVRNAGGSIRDSLPFTAVAALPTGAFWGFGLLNGGTTATMKNFIVEDAPAASTLWGNVANV